MGSCLSSSGNIDAIKTSQAMLDLRNEKPKSEVTH